MKDEQDGARGVWAMLITFALWIASYFAARVVMEETAAPTWMQLLVAWLPVLPFAAFLYVTVKGQRQMDELELRIQVEALAIAFPLSVLFLMVFGLLGEALDLMLERHVWFYLPIFYFVGLTLARRRYL